MKSISAIGKGVLKDCPSALILKPSLIAAQGKLVKRLGQLWTSKSREVEEL
jgi:hypothetical protein